MTDHLAGRWDTFSWLSPVALVVDGRRKSVDFSRRTTLIKAPREDEFLESLCVLVGRPFENRQQPWHDTTWLWQVRSPHAQADQEELIERLAEEVAALRADLPRNYLTYSSR